MIVTEKKLRFNISMLFDVLSKGEDIIITYRGKAKAKLIAYNTLYFFSFPISIRQE